MRPVVFALLAASAMVMLFGAQAEARGRAYCMRGPMSPGFSNCTFDSRAQCRASASGRTGMNCIANPFYKRAPRQG
ncbi:MAG: DUF3551 domain-containing protein [Bradyrhizobium sp.]|nr:DUF3551 domain-containing protein [Bradyrhizobium sp.]